MELLISRQTPHRSSLLSTTASQETLRSVLQTLLRREDVDATGVEVSLLLCDDAFIQELNARYRGRNAPTDVLSFAQGAPEDGGLVPAELRALGDIVISLPTAERQAQRAGWPVENEVTLLAVHGLLHLLGGDDETDEGARLMQAQTLQVLADARIALPPAGIHPFFAEID